MKYWYCEEKFEVGHYWDVQILTFPPFSSVAVIFGGETYTAKGMKQRKPLTKCAQLYSRSCETLVMDMFIKARSDEKIVTA